MEEQFEKFIKQLWQMRDQNRCLAEEQLKLLIQCEPRHDAQRVQRMKLLLAEIKDSLEPGSHLHTLALALSDDLQAVEFASGREGFATQNQAPKVLRAEQNLVELCYTSKVTQSFEPDQLVELAACAENYNQKHNISGILYFDEARRSFMQILEGNEKSVRTLMNRISKDTRHKEIILRSKYRVSKRSFEAHPLLLKTCKDIRQEIDGDEGFTQWAEHHFNIADMHTISKSSKWVLENIRENCLMAG